MLHSIKVSPRRALVVSSLGLLSLFTAASPAGAGTLSLSGDTLRYSDPGGGHAETNDLVVTVDSRARTVTVAEQDSLPIGQDSSVPRGVCRGLGGAPPTALRCDLNAVAVGRLRVDLGNGSGRPLRVAESDEAEKLDDDKIDTDDGIPKFDPPRTGNRLIVRDAEGARTSFLSIEAVGGDHDDEIDCTFSTAPCQIAAGAGNDNLVGGPRDETINAGEGDDSVTGGGGNDTLDGGPGSDVIVGVHGDDDIEGGQGDDYLEGGFGNDTFTGGPGLADGSDSDRFIGGLGRDVVTYEVRTEPLTISLDARQDDGQADERDLISSDIEQAVGGDSDDVMSGRSGLSVALYGGPGSDRISVADNSPSKGNGDRVDCGSDGDIVTFDPFDRLTGCEDQRPAGPREKAQPLRVAE